MHLSAASLTSHITHTQTNSPPADSLTVPFRACTPHDHSSFKYSVDDILQIILGSRKSWKSLKGKSEAVWPPYLEATMLKGTFIILYMSRFSRFITRHTALQEYEPDDSRETRMLGRYPMRNRFISDYIHSTTGKFRSAKQVGSRIQQLRDTPGGRKCKCHIAGAVYVRSTFKFLNYLYLSYHSDRCIVALLSHTDGHRHLQCTPANHSGFIFQPLSFHYILRQLFHVLLFRFSSHPYKLNNASLPSTQTSPTCRATHARLYRHRSATTALAVDRL
jgi:hypothetical protein